MLTKLCKFSTLFIILILVNTMNADEIKLGASFLKMNYVETQKNGKFLDSETTDTPNIDGFNILYGKDLYKNTNDGQITSMELSLKYLEGTSNYNGFLQNTSTGIIIDKYQAITQDTIIEPKLRLTQTKYTSNYNIGLFISFGDRGWTRDMSSDKYGYKEIYDWKYYDYGIKTIFYDKKWEIGFEYGLQKAIKPTMTAYLNKVVEFNLNNVDGHYYKIPLSYNLSKNLKLELEFEYNEWNIGASNVINGQYEPDSITKNKLYSLNIIYKF